MATPLRASLSGINAADNRDDVLRCVMGGVGDCLSVARIYTVRNGVLTARLSSIGGDVEDCQGDAQAFRADPRSVIGRVIEHGGLFVGPLPEGDTTRLVIPSGPSGNDDTAVAAIRIRRRTVAVLVGRPLQGVVDVRRQIQELVEGAAKSLAGLIVRSRDPELEALRLASSSDELVAALVSACSKHLTRPHSFVLRDGVMQGRFAFVDGELDSEAVRGKIFEMSPASIATRAVHDGLVLLGPCPTDDPILDVLPPPLGEQVHLAFVPIAIRRRTVCLIAGFVEPDDSVRVAPFLRRVQKQGSEAFARMILRTKGGIEPVSAASQNEVDRDSVEPEEPPAGHAGRSLAVVGVVLVFVILVAFWYGLFFDKNPVREILRLFPSVGTLLRLESAGASTASESPATSSEVARILYPRERPRWGVRQAGGSE